MSDEDPLVRENALKQIPRVAECLQKEEGPPEGDDFQNIPEVYAQILEVRGTETCLIITCAFTD